VAYEVEWAESAIVSLVEAIDYVSKASPSYAATLAMAADRVGLSLVDLPDRGRRVTEFDDPSVRELPVGSYRLIYRVRPARVSILAFVHTSRDLAGLLKNPEQ
jgi:plasmid stabilization system protein ParE